MTLLWFSCDLETAELLQPVKSIVISITLDRIQLIVLLSQALHNDLHMI